MVISLFRINILNSPVTISNIIIFVKSSFSIISSYNSGSSCCNTTRLLDNFKVATII